MMWWRALPAICYLTCLYAVRIPSYDYYDMNLYYELKNLLEVPEPVEGSGLREVRGWGPGVELGQVAGVAVDLEARPVIVHRGSRVWDYKTFNNTHHYQGEDGTLAEDPVLVLNPDTGTILRSWGRGRFLLPHGITIDSRGNTWITDVALHQVFKFPAESESPELTLGEAGAPGSDDSHFCQPTSVAVTTSGDVYVADGYCNARILRFTPDGILKEKFGHPGGDGSTLSLDVPHGLTVDEARDTLCVADRENRRVVCMRAGLHGTTRLGHPLFTFHLPTRSRIFDVTALNGVLVGVGGSAVDGDAAGFTADLSRGEIVNTWGPVQGFRNPHALAISADGSAVYVAEIGPNRVWKFTVGDIFPKAEV